MLMKLQLKYEAPREIANIHYENARNTLVALKLYLASCSQR